MSPQAARQDRRCSDAPGMLGRTLQQLMLSGLLCCCREHSAQAESACLRVNTMTGYSEATSCSRDPVVRAKVSQSSTVSCLPRSASTRKQPSPEPLHGHRVPTGIGPFVPGTSSYRASLSDHSHPGQAGQSMHDSLGGCRPAPFLRCHALMAACTFACPPSLIRVPPWLQLGVPSFADGAVLLSECSSLRHSSVDGIAAPLWDTESAIARPRQTLRAQDFLNLLPPS